MIGSFTSCEHLDVERPDVKYDGSPSNGNVVHDSSHGNSDELTTAVTDSLLIDSLDRAFPSIEHNFTQSLQKTEAYTNFFQQRTPYPEKTILGRYIRFVVYVSPDKLQEIGNELWIKTYNIDLDHIYETQYHRITDMRLMSSGVYYCKLYLRMNHRGHFDYRYVGRNRSTINASESQTKGVFDVTRVNIGRTKDTPNNSGYSTLYWPFGHDGSTWYNDLDWEFAGWEFTEFPSSTHEDLKVYDYPLSTHSGKDYWSQDWRKRNVNTENEPLKSCLDGRVTKVDYHWAYGKRVEITQKVGNEKIIVLYAHLNHVYVVENQIVQGGVSNIGTLGRTGNADGAHLHLSCYYILADGSRESNRVQLKEIPMY